MPKQIDLFFMDPDCPRFDQENDPRIGNAFEEDDLFYNLLKDCNEILEHNQYQEEVVEVQDRQRFIHGNDLEQLCNRYCNSNHEIEDDFFDNQEKNHSYQSMFMVGAKKMVSNETEKKQENFRGKYNILTQEYKRQIVEETRNSTVVEVSRRYGVSVNNICRWRKRCDRRSGAGRKITDIQMERNLLKWIKQNPPHLSRKVIQQKARQLSSQISFKASKGWFERFFKRNKLSIQIQSNSNSLLKLKKEKKSVEKIQKAIFKIEIKTDCMIQCKLEQQPIQKSERYMECKQEQEIECNQEQEIQCKQEQEVECKQEYEVKCKIEEEW